MNTHLSSRASTVDKVWRKVPKRNRGLQRFRRLRLEPLESRLLLALVPLTVDISRVAFVTGDDPEPTPFDSPDWYAKVTIGDNAPWTSPEVSGYRVDVDWSVSRPVDTDDGVVRVDIQVFDEDPGDDYLADISIIPGRKHLSLLVDLEDGAYVEDGVGGVSDIDSRTVGDGDAAIVNVSFDIDTDGDGLFNRWELHGFDIDKDGTIDLDLPLLGADASRKDVFVEVDAMRDATVSFAPSLLQTTITNVTPGVGVIPRIVITSANHGLTTGARTRISGVNGVPGANGDFTVTRLTANTFQLDATSWNAGEAYISGGSWLLPDLVGTGLALGTSLDLVVNTFYNAPVLNPDGSSGINLHYRVDEGVAPQIWDDDADNDGVSPYGEDLNADGQLNDGSAAPLLNEAAVGIDFNQNGNMTDIINEDANGDGLLGNGDPDDQIGWLRYQQLRQSNFGTPAERADPNATQILAAKALVYRYAVFTDRNVSPRNNGPGVTLGVSGWAYDGGSFIVSLGGWNPRGGTIGDQAGTFMHELGHTLGLGHGGSDGINNKPNYFSVMNFTWQTPDNRFQESWALNYSSGTAVSPINENSINESAGLGGRPGFRTEVGAPIPPGSPAGTATPTQVVQQTSAVDFDQDGTIGTASLDLNFDGTFGQTLTDFDDWGNLVYTIAPGAGSGSTIIPDDVEFSWDLWLARNEADLAIVKTSEPDPVVAGDIVTYTLTVTNNGPNPADQVQVVDTLPAGVAYVSDDAECVEAPIGTVTCVVGALSAGATREIIIRGRVDPDLVYDSGGPISIINQATVEAPAGTDPNNENNVALEATQVTAHADLEVTQFSKTERALPLAGDPFEYKITIENHGPSVPTNVMITDHLLANSPSFFVEPASYVVVAADGTVSSPTTIPASITGFDLTLDTIPVGAQILVTWEIFPIEGGDFHNYVRVVADGSDPNLANNSSVDDLKVIPPPPRAPDLSATSDTGASRFDNVTADTTPSFEVKPAHTFATVQLLRDGVVVATRTGPGNVTDTASISDGAYVYSARQVDSLGNASLESTGLLVTIDTEAPSANAPDLLDSSDTGALDDDNVTSKMQPAFSGTTEPNALVRVKANGVVVGQEVATSNGAWEVTLEPLADAIYEITVEAEDLSGNVSDLSDAVTIEVDTLAPQRPTLDLAAVDDTGMLDTDNVTSSDDGSGGIPFQVTAEPGSRVLIKDGETVISDFFMLTDQTDPATAVGALVWTLILPDGEFPLSAEAFDIAGNRSHQSEVLNLVVDRTAPAVSVPDLLASSDTGVANDDNVTNKMQPAFQGTTEPNAKVRVKANGIVVGQGVATSTGEWEINVGPLDDDIYDITVEAEDRSGNVSNMPAALRIEVDTLAPNTPYLDLVEADDSGRHNDDNITNINTPLLSATTHDPNAAVHLSQDNFKYRIYDRLDESNEVLLYDSFATIGALTGLTHVVTTTNLLSGTSILGPLADGIHNLKLEVEDRAGNISDDSLLNVQIDTVTPSGTVRLHPDSDSGIWGIDETMSDGITSDMTPSVVGETEANALVRAEIDGVPAGTAVAVPLDGDDAFPPPSEFVGNYRLDTILNLSDGEHTIELFFRDVAGNETSANSAALDIIVDTHGPRITNVTFDGSRSLFEPKPSRLGPEPNTASIVLHFDELPNDTLASEEGHYQLIGDANGYVAITDVIVVDTETTVELVFDAPLYDDRYTLSVSDALSDSGRNLLDGESGAVAPFEGNDVPEATPPIFPTGDGAHGGSFQARFTIDARPEIGTYLGDGTWYVDLNGNGVFDPENSDPTNRDIVWKFGTKGDLPVTGDWNGDGYDEIGVLGKRGGKDFFFLDLDRNGAFDSTVDAGFEFTMNGAGNGLPIAGDWDADGSDEVAVLKGASWFIDDTATAYTPVLTDVNPTRIGTSLQGLPVAGDWDGDGDDNIGTYNQDQFFLDTDDDFSGSELIVDFPEFDFGGLSPQPVAHDWDQDGDDDIGLFIRRETGNNSGARESGEWLLDVNTDLSGAGTVDVRFEPPPTGQLGVPLVHQDAFYNFGDEREPAALGGLRPVVGNFDPPIGVTATFDQDSLYTNLNNNLDVNGDGYVTSIDALVIINELNSDGAGELALPAKPDSYTDTNGDGYISSIDALLVINSLNSPVDAEGESSVILMTTSEVTTANNDFLLEPSFLSSLAQAPSSQNVPRARQREDSRDAPTSVGMPVVQVYPVPSRTGNDSLQSAHDQVLADEGLTELDDIMETLSDDLTRDDVDQLFDP